MSVHTFTKASVRLSQLGREITNAGLSDTLAIEFSTTLSSGEESTLQTVVDDHTPSFVNSATNRLNTGHISGARMIWVSSSQVSFGTNGKRSSVRDLSDEVDIFWSGTLTVDFTTSGINGLDTESVQSNTWYRIFVLADELGINPVGVIATAAASPMLPNGYTHFRRLGWARTDGSGNIIGFRQKGDGNIRSVFHDTDLAKLRVLNNGSATSFTVVDLSNHVPTTSDFVHLNIGILASTDRNKLSLRPKNITATGAQTLIRPGIVSGVSMLIPLDMTTVNQGIEYKVDSESDQAMIVVFGYQDEL